MVASSLADTMRLKTGWKITLLMGALCPVKLNFSGGLGIHSDGDLLPRVGAPSINSFSASESLDSNSITYNFVMCHSKGYSANSAINRNKSFCDNSIESKEREKERIFVNFLKLKKFYTFFCNRMTEVHFFSKRPPYFLSTSPGISASFLNASSAS